MLIEEVVNFQLPPARGCRYSRSDFYKFDDTNFCKDYRKTAAILDAKTRETLELLKKD